MLNANGARERVVIARAVLEGVLLGGVVAGNREGLVETVVVTGQRLDDDDLRAGGVEDLPTARGIADHEHLMPLAGRPVASARLCCGHRGALSIYAWRCALCAQQPSSSQGA